MSNRRLTITLDVPEELLERAEAIGLSLDGRTAPWMDYLQQDIRRLEAARDLFELSQRMDSLPDDEKPSLDDIKAAVKQARAELRANPNNGT